MANSGLFLKFFLSFFAVAAFAATAKAQTSTSSQKSIEESKACFYSAKTQIENMLSGKEPLDYEKAVFITENAYWDERLNYPLFKKTLDFDTKLIQLIINFYSDKTLADFEGDLVTNSQKKYDQYISAVKNAAIFRFLTDTSYIISPDQTFCRLPFQYSYTDPLAVNNWRYSQVINLLRSPDGTGNCYALSSLFKIFAERLKTDAKIATAPNHVYIVHADEKGIEYNIELGSRTFPGNGSIETLTYVTEKAVKSGIAMRQLDLKQSIGLTLIYLAKSYQNKFGNSGDDFVLSCANTVLKYDDLNLNAMLLKAEITENRLFSKFAINKISSPKQVSKFPSLLKDFTTYQDQIAALYDLGYLEMPVEMKNILISAYKKDNYPVLHEDHTPTSASSLGCKHDTDYITLSGGLFEEMHFPKPTEKYSRVVFDTKTRKIISFQPKDTTYNNYNFDPVLFALSVDPMTAKYEFVSPYQFVNNSPLRLIDKDGNEWVNPYTEQIAQLNKTLLDNPNDKKAQKDLATAQKNEAKVNDYLSKLKTNDQALYDYVDKLQVKSGEKTANVKVNVFVSDQAQGDNGQTAQTKYSLSGTAPNVDYKDGKIIAPVRPSKTNEVGFDVTVYGNTSFGDERLANEAGDIMYYMEYNAEASKDKSQSEYFKPGGGGKDAYLNSGAGAYSNRVESKYRERKKNGEGKKADSNPYPLAK